MAISIGTIDGWKAAEICGVIAPYIDELKTAGVTITVSPSKVSFMKDKELLASFMCKSSIVAEVVSAGKASVGLSHAFQHAAKMAMSAVQSSAQPEVTAEQIAAIVV